MKTILSLLFNNIAKKDIVVAIAAISPMISHQLAWLAGAGIGSGSGVGSGVGSGDSTIIVYIAGASTAAVNVLFKVSTVVDTGTHSEPFQVAINRRSSWPSDGIDAGL